MTQYATREEWLNAFIDAARPQFVAANAPLPINVRVAVGFTSRGSRSKRIGECWSSDASGDGHFEIFIAPTLNDVTEIAAVLTHELVHAAVGIAAGHGPHFKRVATSIGLGGKMQSTVALAAWYSWASPIIASLGDMPYAALTDEGESNARKKQKAALLKLECPACGWLARVTAKHIEPHAYLRCPVPDCVGELYCEELHDTGEGEE